MKKSMVVKYSKALLLLTTAIFFTVVVLNNLIDYGSNFEFVKHVLSMDTTFEGNKLLWRSVTNPLIHHIFYWIIIIWETVIAVYLWSSSIKCFTSKKFEKGITKGIIGLTLALLLWFFAFITVGGEWFAMWQSPIWNGQNAALRMFIINGITLIYLYLKE